MNSGSCKATASTGWKADPGENKGRCEGDEDDPCEVDAPALTPALDCVEVLVVVVAGAVVFVIV